MRIEIIEIRGHGVFDAWHNGEMICDQTRIPFLDAARALLARGADPDDLLEMTRAGSDRVDMFAKVGDAAKLTVWEGDLPPRFAPYKPYPGRAAVEGNQPLPLEGPAPPRG